MMESNKPHGEPTRWFSFLLFVVFFLSGFAALVYQVVWQRSLFAIYGINIESVTIVVTAFMLGLGIGSLTGGALSQSPKVSTLLLFSLVELGIGIFGFFSLGLFHHVGGLTLSLAPVWTGVFTFLLLLFPTLLMGSTLPLLVAHLVRASGNVGRSVGMLYFVNTLGSAVAAFASVLWLLGFFGQSKSVLFAATLNVFASSVVFCMYVKSRRTLVANKYTGPIQDNSLNR